jgi:hypothetical protein
MNGRPDDGTGPVRSKAASRTGVRTPPGGNDAVTDVPVGGELLAAGVAQDLREQIQRAEGVLVELREKIAEHRQAATDAADSARGAAYAAGQAEVSRFTSFFNGEMHVAMAAFDGAVHRARQIVLASIRPKFVSVDARSGWVTVQFDGDMPSEDAAKQQEPR